MASGDTTEARKRDLRSEVSQLFLIVYYVVKSVKVHLRTLIIKGLYIYISFPKIIILVYL